MTPTNIHHQLRPRKSRCKTGCLCCRLRKKKCDETRPICTNCTRQGLICSWPTPNEFAWRRRMGLAFSDTATSNDPEASQTTPTLHCPESDIFREEESRSPPRRVQPDLAFDSVLPALNTVVAGASHSPRLLQSYVEQIVPYFLCTPEEYRNPFVQDVLPVAFSDRLVMNAVLALGGSTRDAGRSVSQEEEREVLHYYGQAIKDLKLGLTEWVAGKRGQWETIRVFLTIVLLCHYEIIRGNKKGHFFHHLRAGRIFASVVYAVEGDHARSLAGVLLENYVFFELVSSLRLTPDQVDITAVTQIVLPQLENLRRFKSFGIMLGGTADLVKYVPEICLLACRRKEEVANGVDLQCEETFQRIGAAIAQWESSNMDQSDSNSTLTQGMIAAGVVFKNALSLFLMSAYVQEQDKEYLRQSSQPLVDIMIEMLPILGETNFANTSFWPIIVTASYALTEKQRAEIIDFFPPFMPVISRALEILQWIWEGPQQCFGLLGMAQVVETHCTSYCFG